AQINTQVAELEAQLRPLEAQLKELRGERDLLLTERRRRERLASRLQRADLKTQMKAGELLSVAELVSSAEGGSFEDYRYNLKTGGEVRLGFPQARAQSLAFSDGKRSVQAGDLVRAAELYAAGWFLGTPGRPGVRVNFPGSRQERVAPAEEIFVRPA
ncbi:MAG: hypothetical protein ACREN8_09700, partial [Candidatus Dormibacteraceae bacterium]